MKIQLKWHSNDLSFMVYFTHTPVRTQKAHVFHIACRDDEKPDVTFLCYRSSDVIILPNKPKSLSIHEGKLMFNTVKTNYMYRTTRTMFPVIGVGTGWQAHKLNVLQAVTHTPSFCINFFFGGGRSRRGCPNHEDKTRCGSRINFRFLNEIGEIPHRELQQK